MLGRRATPLVLVLVATVGPAAHARVVEAAAPSPPRPDIVVVLTDDQRWDTLDAMPFASRLLVRRGVRFSNAFVVNPLCCPSRASLLTGRYSHGTGVYRQTPPWGGFAWFDDRSTLATWLDAVGYETAFVGKYIDAGQSWIQRGYVPPGWDRWVAFVHAQYEDYVLSVDGELERYGSEPQDYSTDVLADHAAAFLRDATKPAFLLLAVAAPHWPGTPAERHVGAPVPPWEPPPSVDEADVADKPPWIRRLSRLGPEGLRELEGLRARQLRSLLAVDEALRRLVRIQRARGRLHDTVFVLTSDNGVAWGEHRWTKKEVPYDESVRVPLVIRYDRLVRPHVEPRFALNIDLAPTLARLAGAPPPAVDGESLAPLLRGVRTSWRTGFLIEHLEGANPIPSYCALRTERFLYVEYATGWTELYDLRRDPLALRSLDRPGLAAVLSERLARLCDPPPPELASLEPRPAAAPAFPLPDGEVVAGLGLGLALVAVWLVSRRRRP
jgi:arylsulfatase A-like enzyme